jgi:hypothetical protein
MKSEKDARDLPVSWKLGINITTRLTESNPGDATMVLENSETMKGGPQCTFHGKGVPCFMYVHLPKPVSPPNFLLICSPTWMWRFGNKLMIVQLHYSFSSAATTAAWSYPFLTIFLDYIHKKEHPWAVCIGVPYGTHIW